MANRVEVKYDAVDGQVGEGEGWNTADLLASRVESGEADTLCVSQVLDDQFRDSADAAVTADVVARRADAPSHFRSGGVVERGIVDRTRRWSCARRTTSRPSTLEVRHSARRQNHYCHGNDPTHISNVRDNFFARGHFRIHKSSAAAQRGETRIR